ncbi:MAG: hypothetical protein ABI741_05860 [Ferruginibacter sp.]
MKRLLFFSLIIIFSNKGFSQDIILKDVLKASRDKLYRNLINNSINKNLSAPLNDSTEEKWEDAFAAMEFLNYRSPWANNKIKTGIDSIEKRSVVFQRAILELLYVIYPAQYDKEINSLLEQTTDPKIFAMCAEYLLRNNTEEEQKRILVEKTFVRHANDPDNPFFNELLYQLIPVEDKKGPSSLNDFLEKKYLPGNTLIISFQRLNRDYPGLVMVRDGNGNFIKEGDGNYFAVPQLARSVSNLPGYLTNGNTPEGIFRMDGFDHSKSSFIGPTTNIQLTMPFEFNAWHFFRDSTLSDSAWDLDRYKRLLPENFRNHFPLFQAYYAGKAGRTEIIAHGTTINPEFFKTMPCYPITPTQGCLCTKEIWSETTGRLLESDQQKLADAITIAGGPNGYAIVININDKQEPVSIDEIIPFLKLAMQK